MRARGCVCVYGLEDKGRLSVNLRPRALHRRDRFQGECITWQPLFVARHLRVGSSRGVGARLVQVVDDHSAAQARLSHEAWCEVTATRIVWAGLVIEVKELSRDEVCTRSFKRATRSNFFLLVYKFPYRLINILCLLLRFPLIREGFYAEASCFVYRENRCIFIS